MTITIEYYGPAREAAGFGSERVEVESATARLLIAARATHHGGRLAKLLLDAEGRLKSNILIAVGDRQVEADSDVELRDGDEIIIVPPVSGG